MRSRILLQGLLLSSLTCVVSCQWGQKRVDQVAHAPVHTNVLAPPLALAPEAQLDLSSPPAIALAYPDLWASTVAAYARNDNRALWFSRGVPRKQVSGLRDAIANVAADGLDPAKYQLAAVTGWALMPDDAVALTTQAMTQADLSLSFVAVLLARDLQQGLIIPDQLDHRWAQTQSIDHGALLYQAAHSENVEAALRALAPQHPQYQQLRNALVEYRVQAQQSTWPLVPEESRVKPGRSGPAIAAVRARLTASGHLAPIEAPEVTSDDVLDERLMEAVMRFQREHGLNDDGIPGSDTLAAMNVPLTERVRQLELNLERWRWLPEDLGATHVLVNVPAFELIAVENRQPVLQMRVVTGRTSTPTPIFHSAIQSVVLSPYWNVPSSILNDEVRPGLAKDPGYLRRKNMEVLRNGKPVALGSVSLRDPAVRVRQRPGASNSLGHVKFLFPNEFNVYLHDTPSDSLFARAERSLSHGCVRLEKPFEFARWVLRESPEWDDQKIQAAMDSGRERHVKLANDIPIFLVYHTAWVNDDGALIFAKDLYGHDRRQAQALPVRAPETMVAQEVAAN